MGSYLQYVTIVFPYLTGPILVAVSIIVIRIIYHKLIRILNHTYNSDHREVLVAMEKNLTRSDITHIYQSLYFEQINRYSTFIKGQIIHASFVELYNLCFPDSIMTTKRIEAVLANLVYNIHIDNSIIPKGENCIPIRKALNQLNSYYTDTYVIFDDILKLYSHMVRQNEYTLNSRFKHFNQIADRTVLKSVHQDLFDLYSYAQLYKLLQRNRSFQVIDLKSQTYADHNGWLRLFVYIPEDMDIVELSTVSMSSSNIHQRRSAQSTTIITSDRINQIRYDTVKVFFPFDNLELQNIIHYLDSNRILKRGNTPIIIAQITSLYPTYGYDGTELDSIQTKYSNYVEILPFIVRRIYSKVSFKNKSQSVQKSSNHDSELDTDYYSDYKDVYYQVVVDAMRLFDFIKDSGLATLDVIEIQCQDVMTLITPQLASRYEALDLKPTLKFKLIDPICYPYSFQRIYKSIRSEHSENNRIVSISSNPTAMNMLHGLGLVDLYMGTVDVNKSSDNQMIITTHPLYTSNTRIGFSQDRNYYTDSEKLKNVLQLVSRVGFYEIST